MECNRRKKLLNEIALNVFLPTTSNIHSHFSYVSVNALKYFCRINLPRRFALYARDDFALKDDRTWKKRSAVAVVINWLLSIFCAFFSLFRFLHSRNFNINYEFDWLITVELLRKMMMKKGARAHAHTLPLTLTHIKNKYHAEQMRNYFDLFVHTYVT